VSGASDHLAHTLVPLRLGAELVFSKVYEGRHVGSREETLDSIASTIAVLAPIYEYGVNPTERVRRLSSFDLEAGMFKGGALRIQFIDGRQPRTQLAIAANDVSDTIETLKSAAL
jgi:hypothetical protein